MEQWETQHMDDLIELPQTEKAYRTWYKNHPHGFIINTAKIPANMPDHMQGMMWHHATCDTIDPKYPGRLVTGDTMKVCSMNPGALAVWAVRRGGTLDYCTVCRDKWLSEYR
jgi:hypothetical protein